MGFVSARFLMTFPQTHVFLKARYISGPVLRRAYSAASAAAAAAASTHYISHDLPPVSSPHLKHLIHRSLPNMKTEILPIDPSNGAIASILASPTPSSLDVDASLQTNGTYASLTNLFTAARALRESEIPVAFPTETVYGLAADATRDAPVENVFKVKGRPGDNPLIVHFASVRMLREFLQSHSQAGEKEEDPIPLIYRPFLDRAGFLPGPLSILLKIPPHSRLSKFVMGSSGHITTFAARIPSSEVARALIHLAGVPIAAPSANVSGRPSPTTAAHVLKDLDGRIEYILDGGACSVGVESTVVDGLDPQGPVILRPGGVGIEDLRRVGHGWENVRVHQAGAKENGVVKAPGMKYRHYAPKATVVLVPRGESVKVEGNVGIISTGGLVDRVTNTTNAKVQVVDLGGDVTDVARGIFGALRSLDDLGVDVIYVEEVDQDRGDVADAVMNRLRKAAEGK